MAASSLKLRSDLHIARKLWHGLTLLAVIIAYHNLDRPQALQAMCIGAAICVSLDILRLQLSSLNRFTQSIFGPFMRESEANALAGTTYMAVGVLIIGFAFPKPVVKLTLFMLAFADPLASYVGLRWGKDRIIGKKTLQGALAAFGICTLISFIFYYDAGMMQDRLVVAALFSGIIGALGELIPVGKLDDNFTFPLIAASGLYGLFLLFGVWG